MLSSFGFTDSDSDEEPFQNEHPLQDKDIQTLINILNIQSKSLLNIDNVLSFDDRKFLQTKKFYKPVPEFAEKLQEGVAQVEFEKRLTDITKAIMSRVFCSVCRNHIKEDVDIFRVCIEEHPVQHLECSKCFHKDRTENCPLCRGDRPQSPTLQPKQLRHDFYHTKCQECPLCTDDTMLTAQQLLEHIETDCAAVKYSEITVDERKLGLLLSKKREEHFTEFWTLPKTASCIQEAMSQVKKRIDDNHKRQQDEWNRTKAAHEVFKHDSQKEIKQLEEIINKKQSQYEILLGKYNFQENLVKVAYAHRVERSRLEKEVTKLCKQIEETREENKKLERHLENYQQCIVSLQRKQRMPERPQEQARGDPWEYRRPQYDDMRSWKGQSGGQAFVGPCRGQKRPRENHVSDQSRRRRWIRD
eukprot:gene358-666_t